MADSYSTKWYWRDLGHYSIVAWWIPDGSSDCLNVKPQPILGCNHRQSLARPQVHGSTVQILHKHYPELCTLYHIISKIRHSIYSPFNISYEELYTIQPKYSKFNIYSPFNIYHVQNISTVNCDDFPFFLTVISHFLLAHLIQNLVVVLKSLPAILLSGITDPY